tara:strand:- start:2501 stop:3433 length:933 start_codon:yes stop_codon:yes gene_type:complete
MKIIITGGMGFVGSNLIRKLAVDRNEIVVVDNFSSNVQNDVEGIRLIKVDLADQRRLDDVNIESADVLIHLAGPSSGPASAKDPEGTIDISNRITFNVLRFSKKISIKRIVFASSMSVYGDPFELPVNEVSFCQPISYYAIAKLSSEHIIQAFSKSSGLEYSILRFFNIYGPGQDLKRMDQGLVSIYLSMLMSGKPFVIKGRLDRIRDLIHIDDVVNSITAVIHSEAGLNQVINVCNGEAITIERLAKTLITHFDNYKWGDVIEEKGSAGDTHQIFGSNEKLVNDIGYTPKFDIESGINDFVSWAKSNPN